MPKIDKRWLIILEIKEFGRIRWYEWQDRITYDYFLNGYRMTSFLNIYYYPLRDK
jgi:hypothetical protein